MQQQRQYYLRIDLEENEPWSRWERYVRGHIQNERKLSGRDVANCLLEFLSWAKETETPATLLSHICETFCISATRSSGTDAPEPSEGVARVWKKDGLTIRSVIAGAAPTARRQSVLAHEIGHLFYASLAESGFDGDRDSYRAFLAMERFCWEFASALCCPENIWGKWTPKLFVELLGENPTSRRVREYPMNLGKLSYYHLRSIANKYRISIRLVVKLLDKHPVLDELALGIAVFRFAPNKYTGETPGLRVSQSARPNWGYVVPNQRAIKQGFEYAYAIYNSGGNQETIIKDELLLLHTRAEEVRWRISKLSTQCAYTPIDVTGEALYTRYLALAYGQVVVAGVR